MFDIEFHRDAIFKIKIAAFSSSTKQEKKIKNIIAKTIHSLLRSKTKNI